MAVVPEEMLAFVEFKTRRVALVQRRPAIMSVRLVATVSTLATEST